MHALACTVRFAVCDTAGTSLVSPMHVRQQCCSLCRPCCSRCPVCCKTAALSMRVVNKQIDTSRFCRLSSRAIHIHTHAHTSHAPALLRLPLLLPRNTANCVLGCTPAQHRAEQSAALPACALALRVRALTHACRAFPWCHTARTRHRGAWRRRPSRRG